LCAPHWGQFRSHDNCLDQPQHPSMTRPNNSKRHTQFTAQSSPSQLMPRPDYEPLVTNVQQQPPHPPLYRGETANVQNPSLVHRGMGKDSMPLPLLKAGIQSLHAIVLPGEKTAKRQDMHMNLSKHLKRGETSFLSIRCPFHTNSSF
jgi:hypothetical protein